MRGTSVITIGFVVAAIFAGKLLLSAFGWSVPWSIGLASAYVLPATLIAGFGSMRSIRAEWHDEDYWQKFVLPRIEVVFAGAGSAAGLVSLLARAWLIAVHHVRPVTATIVSAAGLALLAYASAFALGRAVYGSGDR